MPWLMLAMLGAEAGKHFLMDKPNEDAKRKIAAASQLYGPWINGFKGEGQGQQYDPTQAPNLLAGMAQAGVGGYMQQQNMDDHQLMNQLRQEQLKRLKGMNGPETASGANDLTKGMNPTTYSADGAMGSQSMSGMDARLDPTNPWSGMTEGMGLDSSVDPALWNTPSMDALSSMATA